MGAPAKRASAEAADGFQVLIAIEGEGTIAGQAFRAGEGWYVPAGAVEIEGDGARLLQAFVPS